MGGIRTPRSVKGAQPLCERYAEIEDAIARIENDRNAAIAKVDIDADGKLEPLLAEKVQLRDKLEPWWRADGAALTEGKRKSIELGGCMIGTRSGKESLGLPKDENAAKSGLGKARWGKALLKTTVSFDKRAIAKALAGRNAAALKDMGFSLVPGAEDFVLERVTQEGTRT
ncbi:hypothetical protein E3U23_11255 [Erythrobacter litoralis]|uniref:host-nuclease inhibitor Gam family protein n=1 Tax=Erythrobacter litoralis TaxID=39960 RepID=UPI002434A040|nr:host-nuclease inhibitor Gam family protein [Erythrobacter litoralis]MDG6079766.1 hypothetical protein [Erythrobacter litoralis]